MKKEDVEIVEPIEQKMTDVEEMGELAVKIIKNVSNLLVENIPYLVKLIQKGKKIKALFVNDDEDDEPYDGD